ncbi:MAG: cysteine hydrolase [Bacteroidetes bacterium]|nr:cysteine hydrolase [Bacteroidota bacterium]
MIHPALLLIDIQKGFDDIPYWGGQRNNPGAEENAAILLQWWRKQQWPVFHIRHCSTNPLSPLHPSKEGNNFKDIVQPYSHEQVIRKNVNSAFIDTNLEAQLNQLQITQLVIVGLTTDHCISTTVRMAGNLGFTAYVVADATATFCKTGRKGEHYSAELIHETALASLHNEFATIVTMDEVYTV